MRRFRKTTPTTVPMRFDVPLEELAIRSEMTEDQVRTRVLAEIWDNQPEGRGITAPFDAFNHFCRADERRMKTLAMLHVGLPDDAPLQDVLDPSVPGAEMEISLVDENGEMHPASDCTPFAKPDRWYGRVFLGDDDRVWLHGMKGPREEALEQDPDGWTLMRLDDTVAAGLAASIGRNTDPATGATRTLRDLLPVEAEIGIAAGDTLAWIGHAYRADISDEVFLARDEDPEVEDDMTEWDLHRQASFDAMHRQIRDETERANLFDRVVTPERLAVLKEGIALPIGKDALVRHRRQAIYNTRDNPLDVISRDLMDLAREEGMVAPCPNSQERGIGQMESWNRWVAGVDLEGDMFANMHLQMTPAFMVLEEAFTAASVDVEKEVEKRLSSTGEVDISLTEADVDREIALTRDYARDAFVGGKVDISAIRNDAVTCNVTGERMRIAGDYLAPVLMQHDRSYKLVPVGQVSPPAVARHLELSMPSGQLVMADWLRIPGFKEAMDDLSGEDDTPDGFFDLNSGKGIDDQQKTYYERAGLAYVSVGNTSPYGYETSPGVWRMGHAWDDDDRFWIDGKENPDCPPPKESWRTCTDVWCNIFADREVVVDILMHSGRYADRAAADTALEAYVEEKYGANIIEIGADTLHLYSPTGPATKDDNRFAEAFRAAELEEGDWWDDKYILSTQPLTVAPGLLEDCDWVEHARDSARPRMSAEEDSLDM